MQKVKQQSNFKVVPMRTQRGRFEPITFAFTTRLSLEECVARLEAENPRYSGRVNTALATTNGERYQFRMIYSNGRVRSEANGTIERWAGTETLVKGEASLCYDSKRRFESVVTGLLIIGVIVHFGLSANMHNDCISVLSIVWIAAFTTIWFSVLQQPHAHLVDILEETVTPEKGRKHDKVSEKAKRH
jgi:hypothetical protein